MRGLLHITVLICVDVSMAFAADPPPLPVGLGGVADARPDVQPVAAPGAKADQSASNSRNLGGFLEAMAYPGAANSGFARANLNLNGSTDGLRYLLSYDLEFAEDRALSRSRFSEGWLEFDYARMVIRAGRQRLAWGPSEFFPVNNPFGLDSDAYFAGRPVEDWRPASDALRLTAGFGRVGVDLVMSRQHAADVAAIRLQRSFGQYDADLYLSNMRYRHATGSSRKSIGFSLQGPVANGLGWVEAAHHVDNAGREKALVLLGYRQEVLPRFDVSLEVLKDFGTSPDKTDLTLIAGLDYRTSNDRLSLGARAIATNKHSHGYRVDFGYDLTDDVAIGGGLAASATGDNTRFLFIRRSF